MAKAEAKTKPTEVTLDKFFSSIEDETKRADCYTLAELMHKVTKEKPVMWGPAIVGYGSYHYKYDSGHEGDSCIIGFSPRKSSLTLYVGKDFDGFDELMSKLGKHKMSGGCLHIKKLADVDMKVLKDIITASYKSKLKNKSC
ncbi:MAG: DUF1801 domain-containing protein [Bacteroidetes bacterium]|nr:DUF1801 domain-containing protein [Bacteroidota bacterium]